MSNEVNVGEGYRRILIGETLKSTDEYTPDSGARWYPSVRNNEPCYAELLPYRRRVEAVETKVGINFTKWNAGDAKKISEDIRAAVLRLEAAGIKKPVGNVYPDPVLVACGCGKHSYPEGADPYAEHRDFVQTFVSARSRGQCVERSWASNATMPDPGRALTVLTADPTGDDVAPDAQRTTGGKTLDSVIDEHHNCFEIRVGKVTWHKE